MKRLSWLVTTVLLMSVLPLYAQERNRNLERGIVPKPNPEETPVNITYLGTLSGKFTSDRSTLHKTTLSDTFHLPVKSVYDFGWDSLNDFITVSPNGNVHIAVMVRTTTSQNDRHVYYWYNPGEPDEFGMPVTLKAGFGWPEVGTFSDGRAAVNYHVSQEGGLLIDSTEGAGVFTDNALPLPGAVWHTGEIGNDDVIYWTTHRWNGGWNFDSTVAFYSNDEGESWVPMNPIDHSPLEGGWESIIRVAYDNSEFSLLAVLHNYPKVNLDSTDQTAYYRSTDLGESWNKVIVTFDPYNQGTPDGPVVADVFHSDVGTNDTLIVENFKQMDMTYDWQNNMHMLMMGLSWYGEDSSGLLYSTPILHYSSERGERASNFIELSDPEVSHSEWLDAAIDSGWWPGNNIGIGYPTISAAPDAPILVAAWVQPRNSCGTIDCIDTTQSGQNAFWNNDIWMSFSTNGGANWSEPSPVTDTEGVCELYPVLAKPLEPTGTPGEYRYHLLYLEDKIAGLWTFGESDSSANVWVYRRGLVSTISVDGEHPILKDFSLEQNYPNPFNPVTTISFDLSASGYATLIIYDILGREVGRLVDEDLNQGKYSYQWDASSVASGIYFYRLEVTGRRSTSPIFVRTRKMVLLK